MEKMLKKREFLHYFPCASGRRGRKAMDLRFLLMLLLRLSFAVRVKLKFLENPYIIEP